MNIVNWLKGCVSSRGKALALYRKGMARARKHDRQGAIVSYTATIDLPNAPADVIAMALYNRALVYVAAGDHQHGIDDLNAVLAMGEMLVNIKTMARQKLARIASRTPKGSV